MTRKDGFLLLDNYEVLKTCTKKDGNHAHNWIFWKNSEWLFKRITCKKDCINEVFWGYVLHHFPIASVDYDLAVQKGIYGVISKNFNLNHDDTYSLNKLINIYKRKMTGSTFTHMGYNYKNIIQMYQVVFEKFGEKYINALKTETLKAFILQILLGNSDLHSNNIDVIIDKKPKLIPLYDFERYGKTRLQKHSLTPFQMEYCGSQSNPQKTLLKFLKKATQEELNILRLFMTIIEEIDFNRVLEEMENNIHRKILYAQKVTLKQQAIRNTILAEKLIRKKGISI